MGNLITWNLLLLISELTHEILSNNIDIFEITESWLDNSSSLCHIPVFFLFLFRKGSNSRGGDLAFNIKDVYVISILDMHMELNINTHEIENLWLNFMLTPLRQHLT